jgi:flavin reductase (DIM6/NTAB) family NADH-FMN oxidoreductase RutF
MVQQVTTGDHTLFIGEVLAAYVNEGIFTKTFDIRKVKPVYHIGDDNFSTLSSRVFSPPSPKREEK